MSKRTRAEGPAQRLAQGAARGTRPKIRVEGPTARPVVSLARPNDLPGLQPSRATRRPRSPGLRPGLDDWPGRWPYCAPPARRYSGRWPCRASQRVERRFRSSNLRALNLRAWTARCKRIRANGPTHRLAQGAALGRRPKIRFEGPAARPVVSSARPDDLPGLQPSRATRRPRSPGLRPGLDDWPGRWPYCAPPARRFPGLRPGLDDWPGRWPYCAPPARRYPGLRPGLDDWPGRWPCFRDNADAS